MSKNTIKIQKTNNGKNHMMTEEGEVITFELMTVEEIQMVADNYGFNIEVFNWWLKESQVVVVKIVVEKKND